MTVVALALLLLCWLFGYVVLGLVSCSAGVRAFLKYLDMHALMFESAPGLSGGRGEMAMAVASPARLAFARGAVCACAAVHQTLSFGPCTDAVHGAPGHNRWGVVETPLPAKTQGGTMDCLLTLPTSTAAGWL